eukprot:COSAG01_NODE_5630_length_4133_cov_1.783094_1_plen_130_part_00
MLWAWALVPTNPPGACGVSIHQDRIALICLLAPFVVYVLHCSTSAITVQNAWAQQAVHALHRQPRWRGPKGALALPRAGGARSPRFCRPAVRHGVRGEVAAVQVAGTGALTWRDGVPRQQAAGMAAWQT